MQLSVVVTIVDGGRALERCLQGLAGQREAPDLEVIVPYDDSVVGIESLAARFPGIRFLHLGTLPTRRPARSAAGQHELYDRRRSAGLAASRGGLIAMLEDRGVPRPDWARRFFEAHGQEHEVIGGAIENGRDRALSWALYFCDFGRFQLPFEAGPADWVSDINVCYKRSALERTRSLWEQRYHETTVHWALQRMGVSLFLTPDVVVDQIREPAGLSALLVERFAWGRLFASTRARESGTFQRLTLGALTPLLPGLVLARQVRQRLRRGGGAARFLQALPAIVLLLVAWSAGEMVGYLTADG